MELPLAESKARTAIEKMTADSKTWALEKQPQVLWAKTTTLVANWDTLGWVLYREGKLEESERYLQAAWRNRQSDMIAEHLGEVQQARGQRNAALRTFELGLASVSHHDLMGRKKSAPGASEKKLRERMAALKKAGARSSAGNPVQMLQHMRTFSLGPTRGMSGSAQYWLLLSGGAVAQAKATGNDLPGGIERVKTIKLAGYWPPNSDASLVRKAEFFCGAAGCQLVLEP